MLESLVSVLHSPVNLVKVLRTPFLQNTFGRLFLKASVSDYFTSTTKSSSIKKAVLRGAATNVRYFVGSKFSRSLVHKKNFSLI